MSDSPYIFNASQDNFQQGVIDNSHKLPVFVDFWADWCQPCKILMPIMEKLVEEFNGQFLLAKVNSDEQQQLASTYGVRGIPNVKIFRNGEVVGEFTGVQSESYIRTLIERHLPTEADKLRNEAVEHIRKGDIDRGRTLLEQAAEKDPRNATVQIDLAYLDAQQGKFHEASERLKNLGQEAREKPEVAGLLAKIEFTEATANAPEPATLKQRLADNPKDSEARYQLAAYHAMQGDYQNALEQFLQLVMRDRKYNDDAGRRAMLSIFTLLGDEDELTSAYRRKMFNAMH
ncbi:MAG: co-chaperone YbbN [Gammaproteobacteria bacterium]|nr:MAG: co-chaperone YbbN [Gammaproteobacteria bacterium]